MDTITKEESADAVREFDEIMTLLCQYAKYIFEKTENKRAAVILTGFSKWNRILNLIEEVWSNCQILDNIFIKADSDFKQFREKNLIQILKNSACHLARIRPHLR